MWGLLKKKSYKDNIQNIQLRLYSQSRRSRQKWKQHGVIKKESAIKIVLKSREGEREKWLICWNIFTNCISVSSSGAILP